MVDTAVRGAICGQNIQKTMIATREAAEIMIDVKQYPLASHDHMFTHCPGA
jgi:hypothetical protein